MKKNTPRPKNPPGLRCTRCGCRLLPVYYTRAHDNHILRIRYCSQCGRRFLTRETLV